MSDQPSTSRGRIVMLVDNNVVFDSRVQKEAESAADRGWEVILLGKKRKKNDPSTSWALGRATVRTIYVPSPMLQRRYEYRRALLRSPFAYPQGKVASYRAQRVKAWKADVRFRTADLVDQQGAIATLARGWLVVSFFLARVTGKWVAFRTSRLTTLQRNRQMMTRPLDRLTTKFWQLIMGDRSWRRLDPGIWDWELAFGPAIDKLKPDLIHANDFRMLAIGARAATRAKAAGRDVKLVWDAHEFLPGMRPWQMHPRWHAAQCALEHEFASYADAVVTVSEQLAELLTNEHHLDEQPVVVLNAPVVRAHFESNSPVQDIRHACGLTQETPLLVYSGLARQKRGLDTMIDALPRLEGVHVVLVVSESDAPYITSLVERAKNLGVNDRVHLQPYVPVDDIVPFLATADIGVIPIHHWPNHEIALITKFFEYSQARLPILVSDVEAMATMVRKTGQGEVFIADDVDDFVRAAKMLLADHSRYAGAYDRLGLLDAWTWEVQADELDRVYTRLVPAKL